MTDGAAGRAFNPVALVARRKERNWTQAQLAAKSGRALKTVVAWESGARCPTPAHLLALATTLGVPAAEPSSGYPGPNGISPNCGQRWGWTARRPPDEWG